MKWRQWWALEWLIGVCLLIVIWPLSTGRFWLAIALILVFAPIYLKRVIESEKARKEQP